MTWSTVAVEDGAQHTGSSSPIAHLARTAEESRASSNESLRLKLADARFAESMDHVQVLLAKGEGVAAIESAAEAHALYKLQNPKGLAGLKDRHFATSDAAVEFYETGRLQLRSAECVIKAGAQPIGR